ncbi:MAG TPA: GNAT family N-acetyltransferase [Mycobacteriales bacterium]|nr:GNAT family N-acetyltransferase [Mycobacteriales bacterium]
MADIRPLREEDAEELAALHLAVWRSAYGGLVPPAGFDTVDLAERAERWRATAAGDVDPPRAALVAEQEGRLVGFVAFGGPRDDDADADAEVLALYVDEKHWGTDIGHRLLVAARQAMGAQGHRRFYLWVLADNPRARRFYERAGLVPDGIEKPVDLFGTELPEMRYVGPIGCDQAAEGAHSSA